MADLLLIVPCHVEGIVGAKYPVRIQNENKIHLIIINFNYLPLHFIICAPAQFNKFFSPVGFAILQF